MFYIYILCCILVKLSSVFIHQLTNYEVGKLNFKLFFWLLATHSNLVSAINVNIVLNHDIFNTFLGGRKIFLILSPRKFFGTWFGELKFSGYLLSILIVWNLEKRLKKYELCKQFEFEESNKFLFNQSFQNLRFVSSKSIWNVQEIWPENIFLW